MDSKVSQDVAAMLLLLKPIVPASLLQVQGAMQERQQYQLSILEDVCNSDVNINIDEDHDTYISDDDNSDLEQVLDKDIFIRTLKV